MSDGQDDTMNLRKAISTFCVLSGRLAKLLQERELLPEDYGKQLLNDLEQTIREARREDAENVSEYAECLAQIQSQFRRYLNGKAGPLESDLPQAWEPDC